MPTTLDTARADLDAALSRVGWSYYTAACRFSWQLGWDKVRQPLPPPVEMLHEGQLRQLRQLIETNVRVK